MKKIIVIYHRADFDGIFCREIARKFLGDTAEYIGWDHGDPFVKMPEQGTVYVLDLSPECLDATLIETTFWNRIIWIDHHKSSIEKFDDRKRYPAMAGYRIDGVAACRLTWQWFTHKQDGGTSTSDFGLPQKQDFVDRFVSEPLAVRLAGEYDIWDKRDSNAELFQHGLRGAERDFQWLLCEDAAANAEKYVVEILEQGRAIAYAKTQENEGIIKSYGFTVEWEGLSFLCCNHARFNSHLFTAGIKPEHDALLGFNFDGSKQDWRFSLYGIPGKDIDLSLIAVKHGGGGHRGACGFRLKEIPFLK